MLDATAIAPWERWLQRAGVIVLRYGLVALLGTFGAMKFLDWEAEAIVPLVENHPLMAWLYPVFGVRGTSALIGVVEIAAALAISVRPWLPRVSAYGSLLAAGTFVMTLSFLITTPEPPTGFLLKDLMLLGAALYCAGEALTCRHRRTAV